MSGPPKPSMAPYLLARQGSSDTPQVYLRPDGQTQDEKLLADKNKVVERVRGLVAAAKEGDPSAFDAEVSVTFVANIVNTHCKYAKKKFMRLLVHGLPFESPVEALHHCCSDMLTLNSRSANSGGVSGHVEILEGHGLKRTYGYVAGDIHEVVGESGSRKGLKAGGKCLPKNLEGILWRWVDTSNDGSGSVSQRPKRKRCELEDEEDEQHLFDNMENELESLPHPWIQHSCDVYGIPFYHNELTGESQWEMPELHGEPGQDLDARESEDQPDKRSKPTGYVKILKNKQKFKMGDVHEVAGESCSGSSLRVFAGITKTGAPGVKCLQKIQEGTLWRWSSPPR
eukprot:TRINITY_DN21232_c0_g1_i1.p1 TRINITY_DN21232_c0_g1~~TRINITY_DN21232_c0_g1_i1.p1  ORF type:complete len:341 (-),score=24.09 TRINITY_DN21232_c0_g1_i1:284-1306(-)